MKANHDLIDKFLKGENSPEHITYIHVNNYSNDVILKISPPDGIKKILSSENKQIPCLRPFMWLHIDVYNKLMSSPTFEIKAKTERIKFKNLITNFEDQTPSQRMLGGYTILCETSILTLQGLR